jgi:hypothetical protein
MNETLAVSPEIEPNRFVTEHLAELALSSDLHDNEGAAVATVYLMNQTDPTVLSVSLANRAMGIVMYKKSIEAKQELLGQGVVSDKLLNTAISLNEATKAHEQAGLLIVLGSYKLRQGYVANRKEAFSDAQDFIPSVPLLLRPIAWSMTMLFKYAAR